MQKLINLFKAKSFYHLCKIFVIFGITGSLSLFVSEYILNYIDLGKYISTSIVYLFLKLLFLLVIYQILLILIALIFGEFQYFSRFIKKFLKSSCDACSNKKLPVMLKPLPAKLEIRSMVLG